MSSRTVSFVLVLLLIVSVSAEGQDNNYEVIDLQDLLKNVSSALENCRVQLKESRACGCKEQQSAAEDCSELFASGEKKSGVYDVQPLGYDQPFQVFCDMTTDGGGWTVIQRRGDYGNPTDYFYKTWDDYKAGFGNLRKEFWLGNDKIAALSQQKNYALRVDLATMDRRRIYADYKSFWVDSEQNQYQLHVSDFKSGDAKDSLILWHNGQNFTTKDRDSSSNCSNQFKGGWWYKNCHASNLNGLNLKGNTTSYADGIVWHSFSGHYYSLYSEIKMKHFTT